MKQCGVRLLREKLGHINSCFSIEGICQMVMKILNWSEEESLFFSFKILYIIISKVIQDSSYLGFRMT